MADLTAHGSADVSPADGEVDDSRRKFLLRSTIGMGAVGVAFHGDAVHRVLVALGARPRAGRTDRGGHDQDGGRADDHHDLAPPTHLCRASHAGDARSCWAITMIDSRTPCQRIPISRRIARIRMRSRNGEYLVLIGICTHLGCLPKQHFDAGRPAAGCDLAGRLAVSLPRLPLRFGRTRVRRFTGIGEPAHSALFAIPRLRNLSLARMSSRPRLAGGAHR